MPVLQKRPPTNKLKLVSKQRGEAENTGGLEDSWKTLRLNATEDLTYKPSTHSGWLP